MKKLIICSLVIAASFFIGDTVSAAYGDTTTYLGKLYAGDGGEALEAYLDFPEDITVDSSGNFYIADTANHVIRKINTSGVITTLAGTGSYGSSNGAANTAEFALPRGVALDSGRNVYVADSGNDQIRKIDRYGVVSTLVSSGLNSPQGVLVYGSTVYIADTNNNAIKTVSTSGGTLRVLSNDLNKPKKLTIDSDGTYLYVADSGSYKVKRVNRVTGKVTTIAGSGENEYDEGTGTGASFQNIWGVTYYDGKLFVTDGDGYDDKLRQIDLATNTTSLLARDEVMASLNYPSGLVVSGDYIYVANTGIGTIQRFAVADPDDENELFAGAERYGNRNGSSSNALFGRPWHMVLSRDRKWLYIAENNKVRKVDYTTKRVYHVIGNSVDNYVEGAADKARFSDIPSIAIDSEGENLYVVDRWNNRIRKVDLTTQTSSLLAGGGLTNTTGSDDNGYREARGSRARFNHPAGLVISSNNQYLYVSDTGNNRIRRVTIATGETSLVAGAGSAGFTDGKGSAAKFNKPYGLALDPAGKYLYVADTNNHAIRRITLSDRTVITIVGTGSAGYRDAVGRQAVFSYPEYVSTDSLGKIYVSEVGSHRIRLIEPETWVTKLVTGSGTRGYANGSRTRAEFNNAKGLLADRATNTLLIADAYNDVIRKVNISGSAPFTDPAPSISRVEPNRISPSWDSGSGLRVKIIGANFRHGAAVYFGSLAARKTYVVSATELVAELPLDLMSAGLYDVLAKNSDGQSALLTTGFGAMDSSGNVPETVHPADIGSAFYAYDPTIRGGFFIATGNVTGDEAEEIITGTGDGLGPQVRVFDGDGNSKSQFFAYSSSLRTGVRVASCNLDGKGSDEIVTVPGPGGRPQVRIFDYAGNPKISPGFFALDGKFTGGASIACGDVNGDGKGEILVAAGPGGGPHVTIHKSDGTLIGNFMAYARTFRGGIIVDAIDLNADGKMEVITGPVRGGPHVQIFTGSGHQITPGLFAFDPRFGGGVAVAGGDVDGDGREEMLITPGPEAEALLKVYKNFGNTFVNSFHLFNTQFHGAASIASGDINGDGVDEIAAIARSNGSPYVALFNADGEAL